MVVWHSMYELWISAVGCPISRHNSGRLVRPQCMYYIHGILHTLIMHDHAIMHVCVNRNIKRALSFEGIFPVSSNNKDLRSPKIRGHKWPQLKLSLARTPAALSTRAFWDSDGWPWLKTAWGQGGVGSTHLDAGVSYLGATSPNSTHGFRNLVSNHWSF